MMAGAIMDSTYDATYPKGCLLVLDKNSIGTVLTTSLRIDTLASLPYDFDVSDDDDVLMTLITKASGPPDLPLIYGLSGDGHHNEILKHSINPSTGALSYVTKITWNEAWMDTCDTLNIHAGFFYISCGYWEVDASDGTLPFVAKL